MWARYEFHDDLDSWATELADAALDVAEADRETFLAAVCAGSEPLLDRVRALLAHPWREAAAAVGVCRPGDVIRDCVILRLVGRGGMGEVYRAIQRPLTRIVAVKVITGDVAALAREAASAALLNHPNIVTVHDADLAGARPCLVMEFVEGITLRTWMERRRADDQPPPPAAVRSIVRQTASALGAAHARGLVHCDVKPENILLVKEGDAYRVRVADFGIARRIETPAGPVTGTPGYLAPEQFSRNSPDPRSDLFALGVVVHELLSGRHPFVGRSVAETYFNTLSAVPVLPPDADAALAAVARRALEKAPEDRYPTVTALIADLESGDARSPADALNPLLSELPLNVQHWWSRHSAGALLAFLSAAWGIVSVALSVALGAACVRVIWSPPTDPRRAVEMLFGYAIEPNAGLWYVAGTSMCLLVGCGFLEAASRALSRTRAIQTVGELTDPVARVAAHNRAIFSIATPVIIVLAIAFVAVPELVFRRDHAFGWVQADFSDQFVGASYGSLHDAGKIGELEAVAALCPGCPVHVSAVFNRRDRFAPPARAAFAVFLAVTLGHQMVLAAFLLWIGGKVLFFFWLLSTALLGGGRHGVRLAPDFQDEDDFRFGLGRLDNVYYAIVVLSMVGSLGLWLQAIANISKGTYLLAGDPVPALFGQAVLLLATLALLGVLLLTPAGVFVFLTIRVVDEELARLSGLRRDLESRLAAARSIDEREQLRAELVAIGRQRLTAKKQSLLPLRRPVFLLLLATSLVMLLVLPRTVQRYRNTVAADTSQTHPLAGAVCEIAGNPRPRSR